MTEDVCCVRKKYPYEIREIEGDQLKLKQLISQSSPDTRIASQSNVLCGPKKYILPNTIRELCWDLYNLDIRDDDVWLLGLQRSGTTLTQEIIWLIANDLDYERAKNEIADFRWPALHMCLMKIDDIVKRKAGESEREKQYAKAFSRVTLQGVKKMEERRFLKCHLPISLLPPQLPNSKAKMVFCARNPKDTIVSNYHIYKMFSPSAIEPITFEQFFRLFINGLVLHTPYFEQIKEAWALKDNKNFLLLFYEETRKDVPAAIRKIAKFLEKELTEDQITELDKHVSLENFKKMKSVNKSHFNELGLSTQKEDSPFIRKGEVGGWRSYFTDALNKEADEWIAENLKGTDIVFPE